MRAGSGLLMLAQSSLLWELHATVLHIAPIPHVVEHCGPNEGVLSKNQFVGFLTTPVTNGQKQMDKLQKHVTFGSFY